MCSTRKKEGPCIWWSLRDVGSDARPRPACPTVLDRFGRWVKPSLGSVPAGGQRYGAKCRRCDGHATTSFGVDARILSPFANGSAPKRERARHALDIGTDFLVQWVDSPWRLVCFRRLVCVCVERSWVLWYSPRLCLHAHVCCSVLAQDPPLSMCVFVCARLVPCTSAAWPRLQRIVSNALLCRMCRPVGLHRLSRDSCAQAAASEMWASGRLGAICDPARRLRQARWR